MYDSLFMRLWILLKSQWKSHLNKKGKQFHLSEENVEFLFVVFQSHSERKFTNTNIKFREISMENIFYLGIFLIICILKEEGKTERKCNEENMKIFSFYIRLFFISICLFHFCMIQFRYGMKKLCKIKCVWMVISKFHSQSRFEFSWNSFWIRL